MWLNTIFERFVQDSPITVMVRGIQGKSLIGRQAGRVI